MLFSCLIEFFMFQTLRTQLESLKGVKKAINSVIILKGYIMIESFLMYLLKFLMFQTVKVQMESFKEVKARNGVVLKLFDLEKT